MSFFFKKIRRKGFEEGRIWRYLSYAAGETAIVVIGILIAVYINNRNSLRVSNQIFRTQVERFYQELVRDRGRNEYDRNMVKSQLRWTLTLVNHPDSIERQDLPGMLYLVGYQSLNMDPIPEPDFEVNSLKSDWRKLHLEYTIGNYIRVRRTFQQSAESGLYSRIASLMEGIGIPYFDWSQYNNIDMPSVEGILKYNTKDYYSDSEIRAVWERLPSVPFRMALRTRIIELKSNLRDINSLIQENEQVDREILENYPDAGLVYDTIELLGSGLPGGWNRGIVLERSGKRPGLWSVSVRLSEGDVKFRANGNWTINWGGTTFPEGECISTGPNIPVKAGRYKVVLDLRERKYQFTPTGD